MLGSYEPKTSSYELHGSTEQLTYVLESLVIVEVPKPEGEEYIRMGRM